MSKTRIKETFQIETSEDVMLRIERFFALINHKEGWDQVEITPKTGIEVIRSEPDDRKGTDN